MGARLKPQFSIVKPDNSKPVFKDIQRISPPFWPRFSIAQTLSSWEIVA
jgi:hypothetical protein